MVSYKSTIALLALQLLAVSAAPAADNGSGGQGAPHNKARVHFCTDNGFHGHCASANVGPGCFPVPGPFNNKISSIKKVGSAGFHCTWFMNPGCHGPSYDKQNDGDLLNGNAARFNDNISSMHCKKVHRPNPPTSTHTPGDSSDASDDSE